jgi:hypothetical protein
MSFQNKCKICKSSKAQEIEFCRFYLQWKYTTLVDVFSDDIDNLNSYNLSNHLNNHANREAMKFWRSLRQAEALYEPTGEESNAMLTRIELGLGEAN